MRRYQKVLLIIASVFLILHLALVISGNTHLYKGIANTYLKGKKGPQIDEYDIFPSLIAIPVNILTTVFPMEKELEMVFSL